MTSRPAAPESETPETDALAKDERHHTVAETRYWCNQYKEYARSLERRLTLAQERLKVLATDAIKAHQKAEEWEGHYHGAEEVALHHRDRSKAAETALALVETEIKGHMRVEEELKTAFDGLLEAAKVRTAIIDSQQARIAELEKELARYSSDNPMEPQW